MEGGQHAYQINAYASPGRAQGEILRMLCDGTAASHHASLNISTGYGSQGTDESVGSSVHAVTTSQTFSACGASKTLCAPSPGETNQKVARDAEVRGCSGIVGRNRGTGLAGGSRTTLMRAEKARIGCTHGMALMGCHT